MITSRVESVCCMCDRAVGRGRWQLCPTCEDQVAAAIDRRLGPAMTQTCLGCGSQEAVAGSYCSRCQKGIYDAQAQALDAEPDTAVG
ncbi:MAG: hypothetical protein ABSG67_16535 [Thermoguttaceae bacterium]